MLYSLAILGRECASEFVTNVLFSNSDISSAKNVSELRPNSTANILSYFSKNTGLVNLLLACFFLGQGSEKFKYNLSTSLSKISSITLASALTKYKLSNLLSNFLIALAITLSYLSIPI